MACVMPGSLGYSVKSSTSLDVTLIGLLAAPKEQTWWSFCLSLGKYLAQFLVHNRSSINVSQMHQWILCVMDWMPESPSQFVCKKNIVWAQHLLVRFKYSGFSIIHIEETMGKRLLTLSHEWTQYDTQSWEFLLDNTPLTRSVPQPALLPALVC